MSTQRRHVFPAAVSDDKPVERISGRTAAVVLVAIAVVLYAIRPILLPFVISGALAFVCTPLIERLAGRTRLPRRLWAVAVFLALLALAALMGFLGVPRLIEQISRMLADLRATVEALAGQAIGTRPVELFGTQIDATGLTQSAVAFVRGWLLQSDTMLTVTAFGFAGLIGTCITLVLLFFFLFDGPGIGRGMLRLFPPARRPLIEDIWSELGPLLRRYFVGVLVVVIYAVIAAYIGLGLVLGISHALPLALMTGLFEILPLIGPITAAVIAGLVAVHDATGIGAIVAYVVYATALRLSIDEVLAPVVLGRAARLHPVVVIFCILTGGLLFGVAGVIVGVPCALAIKVTLARLYEEPLGGAE